MYKFIKQAPYADDVGIGKPQTEAEKLRKEAKTYSEIWKAGSKRRYMSFLGNPTNWGEPLSKP